MSALAPVSRVTAAFVTQLNANFAYLDTQAVAFVTPETFGAAGDGVTDDSAAFVLALADGRPIVLDAGKTYCLRDVEVPADSPCPGIYSAGGARIVAAVGATVDSYCFLIRPSGGFVVNGLFFDLPISTDPVVAPVFNRALWFAPDDELGGNYRVENCRFSGASFGVVFSYVVRNSRIASNYVTGTWREGIIGQCYQNVQIIDNILEDGGYATGASQPAAAIRSGFSEQLDETLNLLIDGNTIARYCVNSGQSAIDCFSGAARNIRLCNNTCEMNGAGIEMKTEEWAIGSPDVYDSNAIEGNTIRLLNDVATSGITIFHSDPGSAQGKAANFLVSDNLISCATPPASGATHYGISVSGIDNIMIDGNRIWNVAQGIAVSGTGPAGDTADNVVVSNNTVDAVDHAVIRSGSSNTVNGLYIRGNPLLRNSASNKAAVNCSVATTDLEISGNRIESLAGSAVEIRDTVGGRVFGNTLIGSTRAVITQGTAPSGIKFRRNQCVATTGPAFDLSTGTGLEVQGNDIEVPIGSRTVSGAATYTSSDNNRGMVTADPSASAGGALGDTFSNSAVTSGGFGKWICTTAGGAGAATYKGTEAIA